MEFLHFIHSKEVRDHLKQTGHTFTPREAACVVYACQNYTLEEKKEVYECICEEYDDPELESFLKAYMDQVEKTLGRFYQVEPGCRYSFRLIYPKETPITVKEAETYPDPKSLLTAAFEEEIRIRQERKELPVYCILKKTFDDLREPVLMTTSVGFEPLDIHDFEARELLDLEKQFENYVDAVQLPVPFEGGYLTYVYGSYEVENYSGKEDEILYEIAKFPWVDDVFGTDHGVFKLDRYWNYTTYQVPETN